MKTPEITDDERDDPEPANQGYIQMEYTSD
jgi:hypothetical protein